MNPKIHQEEIERLSYKRQIGTITPQEEEVLEKWYNEHDDTFFYHSDESLIVQNRIWDNIYGRLGLKKPRITLPRMIAAASILLICGLSFYFYSNEEPTNQIITFEGTHKDFDPGSSKAILTLADGKKVDLTSSYGSSIANQSGLQVKNISGVLEYTQRSRSSKNSHTEFNTIEIPWGGEYKVILPDGSKVWLNSNSSLRYRVRFDNRGTRSVELRGEAYFEIAKDNDHPFIVSSRSQKITVHGTSFNVNSYDDEPTINTSLLEGSISLTNGVRTTKLVPGERSVNNGKEIRISSADLSQDIAWKNGYFEFQETDLKGVMRQISRWYGLQVSYSGTMPTKLFTGKLHRNLKLSSALKILSYFDVKFTVSDRDIHIHN